jgi:hypothetical protein
MIHNKTTHKIIAIEDLAQGHYTSDGIFFRKKYGLMYEVESQPKIFSLELSGEFLTENTGQILADNSGNIGAIKQQCGELLTLWATKVLDPNQYVKICKDYRPALVALVDQELASSKSSSGKSRSPQPMRLLAAVACYMYLQLTKRDLNQKTNELDVLHIKESAATNDDLFKIRMSLQRSPDFSEERWEKCKSDALKFGLRRSAFKNWPKDWTPTIQIEKSILPQ